MAQFKNLDTPNGVAELNNFLASNSYIAGYTPSSADVETFSALPSAPDAKNPNALRWWNHINSFPEAERKAWGAPSQQAVTTSAASSAASKEDDFDLFGSDDEEDAAREAEIERRAQEQLAKKAASGKKVILKSAVVIDVKPWEDTTDMKKLEEGVRAIEMEGLEWKAAKLVPIGYGIKKLSISCHVEDEKVSVDDIQDKIQALEDYVQSTDIVTFTKL